MSRLHLLFDFTQKPSCQFLDGQKGEGTYLFFEEGEKMSENGDVTGTRLTVSSEKCT